ncbi:MAG: MFS transporter [Candidatus Binatia bacterium]
MTLGDQERLRTFLPALVVGLLTLAFILAKTGRDALFFQGRGLLQLPMAYVNIGLGSLPLALIFVKVMKTWGARPARVGVTLVAAVGLAAFVPFLEPGADTLLLAFFIFVPAIFGIVFASAWLLATDIFENTPKSEAARAFSKIGASSLAGGMIGGLMAKVLAPYLDPKWLVSIGVVVVVGAAALIIHTHGRFPTNLADKKDKGFKNVGFSSTFSKKYARSLLVISLLGGLAGLLIDFQFYAAAASAQMDSRGNAGFFANFYIMLNLGSLLLQLFATPKIQDRVGLRGGLMILPIALIGGATFVTAAATALSRSVLRVTEGGLRSSVHRSIWEQAFIPVDSAERSFVKLVVDGIGARIGEIIAAAAVLMWLSRVATGETLPMPLNLAWIAWLTLATVALWLFLTQKLRVQVKHEGVTRPQPVVAHAEEIDCERFPDQCPCTTELGKGIA